MSHLGVSSSNNNNNRNNNIRDGGNAITGGGGGNTTNNNIIEYLDGIATAPVSYDSLLALSSVRSTLLKFIITTTSTIGVDDNNNNNNNRLSSSNNNNNAIIAYSYLVAATKQLPIVLAKQQQQQVQPQQQQYHLDNNPRRITTTTTTGVSDDRMIIINEIIETIGKIAPYCKSRITESGILAVLSSFITVAIRESNVVSSPTATASSVVPVVVQCPTLSTIFVEFVQLCYIAQEYDIANTILYNVWPLPNDTRLLSSSSNNNNNENTNTNTNGGTDVAKYYYYRGSIHTMAGIRNNNNNTEYELAIRCYETRLTIPTDGNNNTTIISSLAPLKKLLLVQCLYYTMDDKAFYQQQNQQYQQQQTTTTTKKNKKIEDRIKYDSTTPSGPAMVASSSISMSWVDPEFNISMKEQSSISLQKLLPVPIALPKEIPEHMNKFLKDAFTIASPPSVSSSGNAVVGVSGSGNTSSASSTSTNSVARKAPVVPAPLLPVTTPSPQDGSNDMDDNNNNNNNNPEVMIDGVIESTASPMSEEDIAIESTEEVNTTTTTTTTAAGEPQYYHHQQPPPPKVRIAESIRRQPRFQQQQQQSGTATVNNERTLLLENVKVYYDFINAFMNVDRITITNMLSSSSSDITPPDGTKRLTPRQIFEQDGNYEIVKHCEQALLRRHILLLSTMFSVISLQDIQKQIKVQSIDEVRTILQELIIQYNWPIEINTVTNYVKFPRYTPTLSLPSLHSQRLQELTQLQIIIQQRDNEIATSSKFINYLHKVSTSTATTGTNNKKGKKNQSTLPASVFATGGPRGVEDF